MTHRFKEGGTCAECGQFWPCQPVMALADRISKRGAKVLPETQLDGRPVEDYRIQADIWTGMRAEVRVADAFAHYQPHQRVELTNIVDRYPPWAMRLLARFGKRPHKTVHAAWMRVDWVTPGKIGLVDELSYMDKNSVVPE